MLSREQRALVMALQQTIDQLPAFISDVNYADLKNKLLRALRLLAAGGKWAKEGLLLLRSTLGLFKYRPVKSHLTNLLLTGKPLARSVKRSNLRKGKQIGAGVEHHYLSIQDTLNLEYSPAVVGATARVIENYGIDSNPRSNSKRQPAGTKDFGAFVEVPVLFATDRYATKSKSLLKRYSGMRGQLSWGVATVSIPDDHRVGSLETPRWWKFQISQSETKHVTLKAIETFTYEQFVARTKSGLHEACRKEILMFVHGYNVTFQEAVRRTAQIAFDLEFSGIPMLYSWPSRGNARDYTVDEASVDGTIPNFRKVLQTMLSLDEVSCVHVIAHSMGGRVLSRGIESFPDKTSLGKLHQIVFAAPDIDADAFKGLEEAFSTCGHQRTLYASNRDKALKASKALHRYPRAGDAGDKIIVMKSIDTVDASKVDTSMMGHSYYGDNRSIITDIIEVLRNKQPADRNFLMQVNNQRGIYWMVRQ